jgi:hypothetical protein
MKYSCMLLLVIVLLLLQRRSINQINIPEGFTVPDRHISSDLSNYIRIGNMGSLTTDTTNSTNSTNSTTSVLRNSQQNTIESKFARINMRECGDSGGYSGCAISSPSPPKIDFRYVTLPTNQIDNSHIYTNLSICPKTYQKNMEILNNKISLGQYSGYTPNEYIDKTRYIDTISTGPLPVNPDFFVKDGGTY